MLHISTVLGYIRVKALSVSVFSLLEQWWDSVLMEFATALHDSIRSGIKNTLGEAVMESLLSHLKSPLQSYAVKPRELHKDLCSIFGNGAAVTLERMIVKDLFRKLNVLFPRGDDLDFETYVGLAKQATIATIGVQLR